MFAGLKNKLSGAGKRISGRTDLLEAVCASAALIAAADGSISDDEVAQALQVVQNNETLSSAFDARTIEQTMDKMLGRAKGGFSGRNGLNTEIAQVGSKGVHEENEIIYLIALDVAYADNDCGTKEKEVLSKLAKSLGINEANYV